MNLDWIVKDIVKESIKEVISLGEEGKKEVASEDKRCCLAEKVVYETARGMVNSNFDSYTLMVEGFEEVKKGDSNLKIIVDPLDGTAYYVRQNSFNGFPVSIVASMMDGSKYKDVKAAAIGDLRTGEIWYALDHLISGGHLTISESENSREFISDRDNEKNDLIIASDFYFPENAELRLKLRHPKNPEWNRFECLNVGSVCEQGAKVACGEIDLFYNVVGYKGLELAAVYKIVTKAGGYCLDLNTKEELGETDFKFEERNPVILAKNEEFARNFCDSYC